MHPQGGDLAANLRHTHTHHKKTSPQWRPLHQSASCFEAGCLLLDSTDFSTGEGGDDFALVFLLLLTCLFVCLYFLLSFWRNCLHLYRINKMSKGCAPPFPSTLFTVCSFSEMTTRKMTTLGASESDSWADRECQLIGVGCSPRRFAQSHRDIVALCWGNLVFRCHAATYATVVLGCWSVDVFIFFPPHTSTFTSLASSTRVSPSLLCYLKNLGLVSCHPVKVLHIICRTPVIQPLWSRWPSTRDSPRSDRRNGRSSVPAQPHSTQTGFKCCWLKNRDKGVFSSFGQPPTGDVSEECGPEEGCDRAEVVLTFLHGWKVTKQVTLTTKLLLNV